MITFIEAPNHDAYRMVTSPIQNKLEEKGYKTEKIYPSKGELPSKESKLIFTNYFWTLYRLKEIYKKETPVLYITHGLSPWKLLNKGYQDCKYIFLPSEFERNKAFTSGNKCPDDDHVIVTGWPKHDLLFQKLKNKEAIRQKVIQDFKLDKNKPIIAYLPTFTHRSKERIRGSVLLLEHLNPKTIDNFIISIHGFDSTKNDVKKILSKFKNIWNNQNKYDLLIAADIIIGDISSVMIESLPLNKPLIHLVNNTSSLGLYETDKYGDCILGDVCTNINELKNIIEMNLKKDHNKEKREFWKEKLIYNFGKATEIITEEIIKIYNKEA